MGKGCLEWENVWFFPLLGFPSCFFLFSSALLGVTSIL